MANLITAEYFQEQMATLGLKSSFSPGAYQMATLIEEASDWVEDYCDRKFSLQTVTDYRSGPIRATSKFVANHYPVNSVASAYWEDRAGNTGSIDVSQLRPTLGGIIEWKHDRDQFYPGRFYQITYETGYTTVPTNVQRATALKIALLIQPQYQGPQEREIFMVSNLEAMIVDLLEPHRRERLG